MLLLLLEYLKMEGIKVPSVFFYSSTRMLLAAVTSLIFTIFLGKKFIKKLYEMKIGQQIRGKEECELLSELHGKKKDTPTMGGVLILSSMALSLFLWMDLTNIFTLILFLTSLFLGVLGGIDDYLKLKKKNTKGLRPRVKFLCQLIFASLVALYLLYPAVSKGIGKSGVFTPPVAKEQVVKSGQMKSLTLKQYSSRIYLPFFKEAVATLKGPLIILLFFFFIFVIIGSSNAVNLTDGLDGLAAGCLILVSSVLALFAFVSNNIEISKYLNILYIEGSGEIAVYLFSLAGASLGFLWYNGYPAQVFMGDTGSLALGGIIGVSAVLLKREALLALIGGIFVAEALSVILQVWSYRFRNKKRIFLCAPLHHHFEYKGWPETKVVIRFWILGLLLAIVGIASLKFQ
jgi:phospho-N-acetylmuramoyl-pentapeptide-transferase